MILDKTTFVSRLEKNNPVTDKEIYVTHSGFGGTAAIKINIQPASPELTAIAEGEMFKTYKAFTLASGVVETMRLTVSGTNDVYVVRGREVFDYGANTHYELTLIRDKVI
jgi:hypothetical protein